jgi:excisionase family DNA binding protein
MEKLWTVGELADLLGVPIGTIYQWRCKGYGPRGVRVGKYVRYRLVDIEAWVDSLPSEAVA